MAPSAAWAHRGGIRRAPLRATGVSGRGLARRSAAALLFVFLLGLTACQKRFVVEVMGPALALVPVEPRGVPEPDDDLDRPSLDAAIRQSLRYLDRLPPDRVFQYGETQTTTSQVRRTLLALLTLLTEDTPDRVLFRSLREDFLWFRAAGRNPAGEVLFTGYYLPVLEGRLEPEGEFRYPLYRVPPDVVEADLGAFRSALQGERVVGRVVNGKLVPYHTRAEIDGRGVLGGRGLELLWLRDAVDRFFLHIQGSGRILLHDGTSLNVNYAGTNGHPYVSIGRMLIEEGSIPREGMSMQAIRAFLHAHPERMEGLLSSNPSYVFFREARDGPLGNIDVPITPGRSIATDSRLFPKGALGFIRAVKPEAVDRQGRPVSWRPFSRLVLNQDTGGAIQGAGRVDIYCGAGPDAEVMAGHLQHPGELYFLLKK
jgi:membrane-bound lytic murein transglycosylase A